MSRTIRSAIPLSGRSLLDLQRRIGVGAVIALLPPGCGTVDPSPAELVGCLPAYTAVAQTATTKLAGADIRDAGLLIRVNGETVCRLFFGSYTETTEVLTISAAKWLTAGTVLAAVDKGHLQLDTQAGELFPTAIPETAVITPSQLLSHTSGLLWLSVCMGSSRYTLQSCAERILTGDLQFDPGTRFYYAGPPFTVAGAMVERAMNKSWAELFQSLIAGPVGMTHTSYGDHANPALSEGKVVSTLDDYGRFAQMILDRGLSGGHRVLSEASVQAMRQNHTSAARSEPPYGLGVWLEAMDPTGLGTVISSPGAGGFTPIVDFDRQMVFVLETLDQIANVRPVVTAILATARGITDQSNSRDTSEFLP